VSCSTGTRGDALRDRILDRDIGCREPERPRGREIGERLPSGLGVAVRDHHAIARGQEPRGDAFSDALRTAGDDRDLSFAAHRFSRSLTISS
jgi:hypothetical protein